jgi:type III pantothenate kinase
MGACWLTVDLGNTRAKLALWDDVPELPAAPLERADWPSGPALAHELAQRAQAWSALHGELRGIALAAVGSRELESEVAHALSERWPDRLVREPACGLQLELRSHETIGRDRLYAARGAAARLRRSAIVVDAGTALTVDALRIDASGRAAFLGGAIAPGPELALRALALHGARLPAIALRAVAPAAVPALGRDTQEALRAGAVHGLRGTARALVDAIAHEAQLEDCPVALTGGARAYLLEPTPFCARTIALEPELVHLGLLVALRDARA